MAKGKTELVEVSFPRMVVNVDLVGTNSLLGALCAEFIKKGYIEHIGVLNPSEIVFTIKQVHHHINLYEEINKVRDILKINEKVITIFML